MKFNPVALSARAPALLEGLSNEDFPRGFEEVVDAGWFIEDGAVLLGRFRDSYHGDRNRFTDVVGYEVAVNGRAIPDLDLDPSNPDVMRILLRRGAAFAWQALHKAHSHDPPLDVSAYVTVTPTLFDPDQVTGNVTFCSNRLPTVSYLDVEAFSKGVLVSLESTECTQPLPVSGLH